MKRNERDWAGQLISWIKSEIENKRTVFQDATNDTGVRMTSGRTKFPDVLLFVDKVSGVIFNGWELKFPDTPVDDPEMLENALEKAQKLQSDSFVTWNGTEAIIWGINDKIYSIDNLTRIKVYPKEPTISTREDLADPRRYAIHEEVLRKRAIDILHDLSCLYRDEVLKPAINVSGTITEAIKQASEIIVPQFQQEIERKKGEDREFRDAFLQWKIYESSTLKILESSSRKKETVVPEEILAKFTFYNLIGKIVFYLTLCENMGGALNPIRVDKATSIKDSLKTYFDKAKKIDYQAIFKPYFTDDITYTEVVNQALSLLLSSLLEYNFRVLPTDVIGNILEHLVPEEEKLKFGQYFTPELLANLVAYPAVQSANDIVFDPTSGTGSFLNAFYRVLNFHQSKPHSNLLEQVWGNDVSHFPAILSVINLYKQDVSQVDNFPRVIREDFFNLSVGQEISFPNSQNDLAPVAVPIPMFDGIASNFPFIQQEDIPNEQLSLHFREQFQQSQRAFLGDTLFKINERSDYFTYCLYNAYRFLKPQGRLSVITSNAWLGKEYGVQFKKFLLDNFHIKYIVRSTAEHWFKDSQVSTIFFVLEKGEIQAPTKFVSIKEKLSTLFSDEQQIQKVEDFYGDIDNCTLSKNSNWIQLEPTLYERVDNTVSVCIVTRDVLLNSLTNQENWSQFFYSTDIKSQLTPYLTNYESNIVKVFRGERTGWNPMFIIKAEDVTASGIANEYLAPYIKSSSDLKSIAFDGNYQHRIFLCHNPLQDLDPSTVAWITKFENTLNKNGSSTIPEACQGHYPYWYSLQPKYAHIVTTINPYERFFFTFSKEPFLIDQRLIAMEVQNGYDVELVAALLNSSITALFIELKGISRNLGVLDLNANNLKELKFLNPSLLSEVQKNAILTAFQPLQQRNIESIFDELDKEDRISFDKAILRAFRIDEGILNRIYGLLKDLVKNRVTLKDK